MHAICTQVALKKTDTFTQPCAINLRLTLEMRRICERALICQAAQKYIYTYTRTRIYIYRALIKTRAIYIYTERELRLPLFSERDVFHFFRKRLHFALVNFTWLTRGGLFEYKFEMQSERWANILVPNLNKTHPPPRQEAADIF